MSEARFVDASHHGGASRQLAEVLADLSRVGDRCCVASAVAPGYPSITCGHGGTAETPVLTRPQPAAFSYEQNNLEIIDSSYLIIRGLHRKGGDTGI